MLVGGTLPVPPPTIWGDAAVEELCQQLEKAGYSVGNMVTKESAELIGQLFRDVLKGAKYGKTARHLIEVRNQRIEELENQLKAQPQGSSLERADEGQKQRMYRLLYIASTAIELVAKVNPAKQNDLTILLEKDKNGNFGPRGEIADYWRVVSERDQLRSECSDKDSIIADLLASGDPKEVSQKLFVSSRTIMTLEENLVKAVQSLKSSMSQSAETPPEEVEQLKQARKALENELHHVEKTFAQHLKQCELKNDENERPSGNEQYRQRQRLQSTLDQQLIENKELMTTVNKLELELVQKDKMIETLKTESMQFHEELTALSTRCDLFEKEFHQLETKRIEDDRRIKLMESDLLELETLRANIAELESSLENAQLSFINTDRALADSKDENESLRVELTKAQELKDIADAEIAKLRKQNQTINVSVENITRINRDLKNKIREKELELARLEQNIDIQRHELSEAIRQVEELQESVRKAQDNEDAAVIEKDEAIRCQEQYRNALKETKKRLDTLVAEANELKNRNRFLVSQLAERLDAPNGNTGPDTVLKIQREAEDVEQPNLVSELSGLRLENKLLREKLASNTTMLQKAIAARKEAQRLAAEEGMTVANLKAALDMASERNMMNSYPPQTNSRSKGRNPLYTDDYYPVPRDYENPYFDDCTTNRSHESAFATSDPSLTYPTSTENYTDYASAKSLSGLAPASGSNAPLSNPMYALGSMTTTSSGIPSLPSRTDPSPGMTTNTYTTTTTKDASVKTQFSGFTHQSSLASVNLPSCTPIAASSSDRTTDRRDPKTSIPTPIPVSRPKFDRPGSERHRLSFTERALARIQQIVHECDEESMGPSSNDDTTPRHTHRRNGLSEDMSAVMVSNDIRTALKCPTNDATFATSTGDASDFPSECRPLVDPPSDRKSGILLSDEDYGHGGGYYWSPPAPREDAEVMSAGSFTYTNMTTNRSMLVGDHTERSKALLDGWITERTSNFRS